MYRKIVVSCTGGEIFFILFYNSWKNNRIFANHIKLIIKLYLP